MILMGYGGLGFALLLTGVVAMEAAFPPSQVIAADFVYYHILALLFLLAAARHLFSLPTELKANWIFQIMEGEGRVEWMRAVDRFVLLCGAAPLLLVPLPIELRLLGWRGIADAGLILAVGLPRLRLDFLCLEQAAIHLFAPARQNPHLDDPGYLRLVWRAGTVAQPADGEPLQPLAVRDPHDPAARRLVASPLDAPAKLAGSPSEIRGRPRSRSPRVELC